MSVCLGLAQILSPIDAEEPLSIMIERLAQASDCVNKAVQVC